jgi:hypothetical protein
MGLRFFLLGAAVVFFLGVAFLGVAFLGAAFLAAALFAVAFLAGAFLAGVLADALFFSARVLSLEVEVDDWDWAVAGVKMPSQSRKEIPAKTATTKRRTQTLPTAESWLP